MAPKTLDSRDKNEGTSDAEMRVPQSTNKSHSDQTRLQPRFHPSQNPTRKTKIDQRLSSNRPAFPPLPKPSKHAQVQKCHQTQVHLHAYPCPSSPCPEVRPERLRLRLASPRPADRRARQGGPRQRGSRWEESYLAPDADVQGVSFAQNDRVVLGTGPTGVPLREVPLGSGCFEHGLREVRERLGERWR